jgi:hypothetical protein
MSREVSCFFYGSFMNREVMSMGGMAFGLLTPLTYSTLDALYGSQSRGALYLPQGGHRASSRW